MAIGGKKIPRAPRRAPDFGRIRGGMQGPPTNFLAYGTVGHVDATPAYARIEAGEILVEVTLQPSGDEIVARLECGAGGDGQGFYMPLCYGSRVIVGMPGGSGSEPVIIGRCSDGAWPFPSKVADVTASGTPVGPTAKAAPMIAFLRTQDGHLLAIESGDGGDITIHSGASVRVKVNGGEQILLAGRTHIGRDFTAQPVAATAGPNGEQLPGTQGTAHVPVPNVPTPYASAPLPPLVTAPGEGIVRAKDQVSSDAQVDPAFWTWVILMTNAVTVMAAAFNVAGPDRKSVV